MNPTTPRPWTTGMSAALAFAIFAFLGTLLHVPVAAQCNSLYTYANVNAPGTYITGFTNLANMGGAAFVEGKGVPALGVGADNGNYPGFRCAPYNTPQFCWLKNLTPSEVVIAGATAQNPKWDTCPAYWTDKMTAAVWELTGEGTANHGARFLAMTTRFDSTRSRFNFSLPMLPTSAKVLLPVPAPEVVRAFDSPGGLTVLLRIPSPETGPGKLFRTNRDFAAQLYATDIPRPRSILGWDVYVRAGNESPSSGDRAAWSFVTSSDLDSKPLANDTKLTLTLPTDGRTPLHFSVMPRFADGFQPHLGQCSQEKFFVGPNSEAVVSPSGTPQISTEAMMALFAPEPGEFGLASAEPEPDIIPEVLDLAGLPADAADVVRDFAVRNHLRGSAVLAQWNSGDEADVFYYEVALTDSDGTLLNVPEMVLAAAEPSHYTAEIQVPENSKVAGVTVVIYRTDGTRWLGPTVPISDRAVADRPFGPK